MFFLFCIEGIILTLALIFEECNYEEFLFILFQFLYESHPNFYMNWCLPMAALRRSFYQQINHN